MPASATGQSPHGNPSAAPVPPGISLALARHRAATIADVRYDLRLDVTARDSAAAG